MGRRKQPATADAMIKPMLSLSLFVSPRGRMTEHEDGVCILFLLFEDVGWE